MSHSHVPKFGNWEGDNVPYTVFFENARIEKAGGLRINPNDPEQNPEAFNFARFADGNTSPGHSALPPNKPVASTKYQQKSSSPKSMASESGGDKSASDNAGFKPKHQRRRSDRNKSSTDSQISPSTSIYSDDHTQRSVSVPKFGEWNDKDPRTGDGFTVIFNKVKEEKQIAAARFPPVPGQIAGSYPSNYRNETKSRRCCCLF